MKKIIISSALLLVIIIATLGAISPKEVSLPLYLVILGLLYAFFALVILAVIKLFYREMSYSKQQFIAIIVGFIPVGMVALGSLSRLTFLDVLLVTLVPVLIVWYAVKRGIIK